MKDPQYIVIDEWVGMWIGLYLVEHSMLWVFADFFCFRIFDIFKPGPIGEMDKMDGGIGVMMDDVVAGIYTVLAVYLINKHKYPNSERHSYDN